MHDVVYSSHRLHFYDDLSPHTDQTLFQFVDVIQFCLVESLLYFCPNFGQSDLNCLMSYLTN